MRPTKMEYAMTLAHVTAKMSTCTRTQVGCVLTDERMEQLWVGYNGGPRNGLNECRHPDQPGSCGCVHAEANAVIKAPGGVEKLAFLTMSPCVTCAVMLVNANVQHVHYREAYRDTEGLDVLRESLVPFSIVDPNEAIYSSRPSLMHPRPHPRTDPWPTELGGWMPR